METAQALAPARRRTQPHQTLMRAAQQRPRYRVVRRVKVMAMESLVMKW